MWLRAGSVLFALPGIILLILYIISVITGKLIK